MFNTIVSLCIPSIFKIICTACIPSFFSRRFLSIFSALLSRRPVLIGAFNFCLQVVISCQQAAKGCRVPEVGQGESEDSTGGDMARLTATEVSTRVCCSTTFTQHSHNNFLSATVQLHPDKKGQDINARHVSGDLSCAGGTATSHESSCCLNIAASLVRKSRRRGQCPALYTLHTACRITGITIGQLKYTEPALPKKAPLQDINTWTFCQGYLRGSKLKTRSGP
jgi:hypothetical protein